MAGHWEAETGVCYREEGVVCVEGTCGHCDGAKRRKQMEANHVYIVNYEGRDVECYGELQETANFSVVCDDESDDDIWINANPVTGNAFEDWEQVVHELQKHFDSDILEISAC
jgi:hypothetical protein